MKKSLIFWVLAVYFLCACSSRKIAYPDNNIHFTRLTPEQSGVGFNNSIRESDSVNLIANAYSYMGSGVGIGDFNNDGLPDIFFGANQVSSALYINRGNLAFEDITSKAGVTTDGWITGVSIVDINNDGFDDIYLCVSGIKNAAARKNLLFINNHNLTFSERAEEYGLADTSYSTQAVFFDYDRDGDLDMYLLNHLLNHKQSNLIKPQDVSGNSPARDKLFRNEGPRQGADHPWYQDVSREAGIIDDGYGLGVVVTDANDDGWPDLYVGNDYLANDRLWMNNKNGTFSNTVSRSMKHQSYSTMGVDEGDINNDGLPDLISLDMQPEDNRRKKMMFSFLNYDRYVLERKAGYDDEYIRNMLQLNNGLRNIRDTMVPFFSETGQLAGISETDWSWSVLFADFDNDGLKDIHVTNGLGRDMINNDFISYVFSSGRFRNNREMTRAFSEKLAEYGAVMLTNYCFHNTGNGQFADVTAAAGFTDSSISNGCAYADLDNDGDLDLVISNINQPAAVMRNDARASISDMGQHFISLSLKGDSLNKNGFGSKITVHSRGAVHTAFQAPARGYLSTMDKRLSIGLGRDSVADSLMVCWPDGKVEVLLNVKANRLLVLEQKNARQEFRQKPVPRPLFSDVSGQFNLDFRHRETFFYDYGFQQLLPQKYSQLGPFIAQGDVNGDSLTDFFVGGAASQSGRLFMQRPDGSFQSKDLESGQKMQEDLGCLLFDADGDGDLDLFVNSGGDEYKPGSANYLPRLFKNDGKGNFAYDEKAFPSTLFTSAQAVSAADYDGDGDLDLFIAGRILPNQYPAAPESYLMQNNSGRFTDVTEEVCPALKNAGMITAAIWTDLNNDRQPDLVIAGEWMPVRFFTGQKGKLTETTDETGLKNMNGQWRSLAAADLDHDGDLDLVAGNLGLNTKYRVSPEQPMMLFAKDLDENGSIDPVIAYYLKNEQGVRTLYPAAGRDQLAAQVPSIKKRFLFHNDYSRTDMEQLFSGKDREDMTTLKCDETRSVWLENKGGGKFIKHPLPVEAQIAPVNAILCTDADGDGNTDLIMAGNEYQTEITTGRYDASYGLFLKGTPAGNFVPVPPAASGLIIDGDVKDLRLLQTGRQQRLLLAAINDEQLKTFRIN